MDDAEKTRLRAVVKAEFAKHQWDTFVDEPLCEKVQAVVEREIGL